MPDPRKIVCTECGFETTEPLDMVTHMITLKHCIDPELADSAKDSGFVAEMTTALSDIQSRGETIGRRLSEEEIDELREQGILDDGDDR